MKIFFLVCAFLFIGLFVFGYFAVSKTEDGSLVYINPLKKHSVSILNFGDVMFDRGVRKIIETRGRDPLEYIKQNLNLVQGFDVFIANLEGPIVEMDRGLCQQKAYNFQFASDTPERLKSIGITMVNIANNHAYDCYQSGVDSTKKYLSLASIDYIGDRDLEKSYVIKSINGKKVVFVGIDQTTAPIPVSDFYPLIQKLDSENDYVVVDIHWGTEYQLTEDSNQEIIAHKLIDNGADIIFGHHPHVIEPVKVYKGKAIFYSLGNFVFDQDFGDTTSGLGVGVVLDDSKAVFTLLPYKLKSFAPDFLQGQDKETFCDNFLKSLNHTLCSFELLNKQSS